MLSPMIQYFYPVIFRFKYPKYVIKSYHVCIYLKLLLLFTIVGRNIVTDEGTFIIIDELLKISTLKLLKNLIDEKISTPNSSSFFLKYSYCKDKYSY